MSRCFPYTPLGYTRNGDCGDALIESIKLQKGREITKTEKRKEKKEKKERKEKKEERKEKRKEKKENDVTKLSSKLKRPREDDCDGVKISGDLIGKGRDYQAEQLEDSGLTEEHGQPSCSQNIVYLSDGTQSRYKRRKQDLPPSGSQNHGNIIRISLHKHKEPDTDASVKREELRSTSHGVESRAQQKSEIASTSSQGKFSISTKTSSMVDQCQIRPANDPPCSISGKVDHFTEDNSKAGPATTSHQSKKQKLTLLYRAVVENWIPPPPEQNNFDDDDEEWLSNPKQKRSEDMSSNSQPTNDVSCRAASDLWPRAQYLPEADIFALPYTIPF